MPWMTSSSDGRRPPWTRRRAAPAGPRACPAAPPSPPRPAAFAPVEAGVARGSSAARSKPAPTRRASPNVRPPLGGGRLRCGLGRLRAALLAALPPGPCPSAPSPRLARPCLRLRLRPSAAIRGRRALPSSLPVCLLFFAMRSSWQPAGTLARCASSSTAATAARSGSRRRPRRRRPGRALRVTARAVGCGPTSSAPSTAPRSGSDGVSGSINTPPTTASSPCSAELCDVVLVGAGHGPRRGVPARRAHGGRPTHRPSSSSPRSATPPPGLLGPRGRPRPRRPRHLRGRRRRARRCRPGALGDDDVWVVGTRRASTSRLVRRLAAEGMPHVLAEGGPTLFASAPRRRARRRARPHPASPRSSAARHPGHPR